MDNDDKRAEASWNRAKARGRTITRLRAERDEARADLAATKRVAAAAQARFMRTLDKLEQHWRAVYALSTARDEVSS